DVGGEVDAVRRQLVAIAVPRHERDPLSLDLADADRRRRRPVGRLHPKLFYVVQELVEPGASEDADHVPGGVQSLERAFARSASSAAGGSSAPSGFALCALTNSICRCASGSWSCLAISSGHCGRSARAASMPCFASSSLFSPRARAARLIRT